MRWRRFIEEYSPDLQYIKGENNVVADALSRLPQQSTCKDSLDSFYSIVECHEIKNKTTLPSYYHLLSYLNLEAAQKRDSHLKKELLNKSCKYKLKDFHGEGKVDHSYATTIR